MSVVGYIFVFLMIASFVVAVLKSSWMDRKRILRLISTERIARNADVVGREIGITPTGGYQVFSSTEHPGVKPYRLFRFDVFYPFIREPGQNPYVVIGSFSIDKHADARAVEDRISAEIKRVRDATR